VILSRNVSIPFYDADPAGILFYGNVFKIAHGCFEQMLGDLGIEWKDWFQSKNWGAPIRHCSADFRAPMRPGEIYQVTLNFKKMSESTLDLYFEFLNGAEVCCSVEMTTCFIDIKTFKKIPVPNQFREKISKLL
jgi:acyl-CoA thioesterase FadM